MKTTIVCLTTEPMLFFHWPVFLKIAKNIQLPQILMTKILTQIIISSHLRPFPGLNKFSEDICMMLGRKPNIYFKATWVFVTPALIIVSICQHMALIFNTYSESEDS